MTSKKHPTVTKAALAAARERAELARREIGKKSPSELLTPQELADAAPFYFVLREYIRQLKEERVAAGLTLADLSAKTGMAVEYLSRLETGAQTNPTWKTLGTYANALGLRPTLVLETAATEGEPGTITWTPSGAAGASSRVIRPGDEYIKETQHLVNTPTTFVQAATPALAG